MTEGRAGVVSRRAPWRRAAWAAPIIVLAALGVASAHRAWAGSSYRCLLPNQPVSDASVGYKLRGSRCEGLYANLVDGEEGLWLVGFQMKHNSFAPSTDASVKIKVGGASGEPLLLQVSSIAWRVHYGMDTDNLVGGTFDWSLDVFRNKAIGLGPDDVAAVACTNRCSRDGKTLFLPVEISRAGGAREKVAATILLESRVELSALFMTVLHAGAVPVRDKKVGGSYMPAGHPIFLPVDDLLPGDNDVEVIGVEKAELDSRVSWRGHLLIPKR